eukprot:CAMPEP_0170153916 /NCGR_PEP_ID=MMETSP0033_2-20121228/56565_1 /TAXON_ID=195969 /ORGANISM="Dolichomastix tenuilepis, Strain CCMP3274" /LENGTH=468 /DNA_ID=CAMNT_0010391135 /DNA_START=50 /DNA_END=1454 /DNA_ORIENTATION=+
MREYNYVGGWDRIEFGERADPPVSRSRALVRVCTAGAPTLRLLALLPLLVAPFLHLKLVRGFVPRELGRVARHRVVVKVVVRERVFGGDALLRVELEEEVDEAERVFRKVAEALHDAAAVLEKVFGERVVPREFLDAGPHLLGRAPAQAEDDFELLPLVLAGEDWLLKEELGENAPDRPHVHLRPVLLDPHEQLRRSVPERDDAVREPVRVIRCVRACEAKVGELEDAVVVYQQVGAFDVAVQDFVFVAVVQALQELLHVALDLRDGEPDASAVSEAGEVVVHVLENHVNAPFVLVRGVRLARHNLLHLYDVFVVEALQDFDLPDRRDREALLLVLHAHLLQRHDLSRLLVARHVHLPVRPLPDLFELLKVGDAAEVKAEKGVPAAAAAAAAPVPAAAPDADAAAAGVRWAVVARVEAGEGRVRAEAAAASAAAAAVASAEVAAGGDAAVDDGMGVACRASAAAGEAG